MRDSLADHSAVASDSDRDNVESEEDNESQNLVVGNYADSSQINNDVPEPVQTDAAVALMLDCYFF